MSHRVVVNFSPEAWAQLNALGRRTHREPGQILSDGLGKLKYFDDVRLDGGRILVQEKGSRWAREVILP